MKVTKEQAHENRERVIDVAGTLLREKGIDGIGIVDLMEAAGMTHGGFYRQFKSKDDLVAQAIARAFSNTAEEVATLVASAPGDRLGTLVDHYVSMEHVDGAGKGCSLAALSGDAARTTDPALKNVFENAVNTYLETIASLMPDVDPVNARRRALTILPMIVGAVVVARSVADADLQAEVIEAVKVSLHESQNIQKGRTL